MIQPYKMSSLFGDTGGVGEYKSPVSCPKGSRRGLIIGQRHDGRVVLRGETVSFI